jgi:hypothetical protein
MFLLKKSVYKSLNFPIVGRDCTSNRINSPDCEVAAFHVTIATE